MVESLNSDPEFKEVQDQRPYIVSADINILLRQWAEPKGLKLPDAKFFADMRLDFSAYMKQIFPGFELVTEEELTSGLNTLVKNNGLYPLSLDRVYYPSELRLDITRQINEEGKDMGLGRRAGSEYLLSQFRNLQRSGINEVSIVDDVIFSGDLIVRVGEALGKIGIKVKGIYAGIGIKEGIDLLQEKGYLVECVRSFDSVIDEICERDFYPGIPLSGRLVDPTNNVGVPYILPFGNPGKWASIPVDSQRSLSRFCINQTIRLFNNIEEVSSRKIKCSDLERKVIGFPMGDERFIDALKRVSI